MIVIVSWAIENNLVYFRGILIWPVIVIVSWAVGNNFDIYDFSGLFWLGL